MAEASSSNVVEDSKTRAESGGKAMYGLFDNSVAIRTTVIILTKFEHRLFRFVYHSLSDSLLSPKFPQHATSTCTELSNVFSGVITTSNK